VINNDRHKIDDGEDQKIRADIDGWAQKRESWVHPEKNEDKLDQQNYRNR
jgi:hypothetical protein